MSSENTLTGRHGHVQIGGAEIARITKWTVNPTLASSAEWGDSDSAGHTNRAAGRKDKTFTMEGKFDTTDEVYDLFQEGDIAEIKLYLDESTLYYEFPRALCSDFSLEVDRDTEDIVAWSSSWGEDGVSYYPGEAH